MEVWDLLEKFANLLFGKIQTGLKQTLTLMGLITVFNGLGVKQGNTHIKLSYSTYVKKI